MINLPQDSVTWSWQDRATNLPQDNVTWSWQDRATSLPQDNVTWSWQDRATSLPQDNVTWSWQDRATNLPQDNVTWSWQDRATSLPQDNMYIAGQYETVHGYWMKGRCKLISPHLHDKVDIVLVTTNTIMTFCFSCTLIVDCNHQDPPPGTYV